MSVSFNFLQLKLLRMPEWHILGGMVHTPSGSAMQSVEFSLVLKLWVSRPFLCKPTWAAVPNRSFTSGSEGRDPPLGAWGESRQEAPLGSAHPAAGGEGTEPQMSRVTARLQGRTGQGAQLGSGAWRAWVGGQAGSGEQGVSLREG